MSENPKQPRIADHIPLDKIVMVRDLQIRCRTDDATIKEYHQILEDGGELEPIEIFVDSDDKKLLGDGWHRVFAYTSAQRKTIPAYQDKDDPKNAYANALERACRNTRHGLKTTAEDKRRCTALCLQQWPKRSDRSIARLSGVSPALVAKIREKGFSPNEPRKKKAKPDTDTPVAVNTGNPITQPQEVEPVGSLPEVEAARETIRGHAAPADSNTARVKQVTLWKEQGLLDFPDIREIFETDKVVPALLPKQPETVLLVVKGRNKIDLPVTGIRVKDGVLEIALTAEAAERAFRPEEMVA